MSIIKFDLVFYHKGCRDGLGSLWCYDRKRRDLEYQSDGVTIVPMAAGKFPNDVDVKDKNILMMDVCPLRNEVLTILSVCKELYILDHHKSAQKEIENISSLNFHPVFDMNRSGAQIAWDFFFPEVAHQPSIGGLNNSTHPQLSTNGEHECSHIYHYIDRREIDITAFSNLSICGDKNMKSCYLSIDFFNGNNRPWFIDVIGDFDIWTFKYGCTKALCAYMNKRCFLEKSSLLQEKVLKFFDDIFLICCDDDDLVYYNNIVNRVNQLNKFLEEGVFLLEIESGEVQKYVDKAVDTVFHIVDGEVAQQPSVGGRRISDEYPVLNVKFVLCDNYTLASDIGHSLCQFEKDSCDFAAIARYNYEKDEWSISCRGKDKVDLSVLCKSMGGGGHFNAAGFTLKNEEGILQKIFSPKMLNNLSVRHKAF